MNPSRFGLCGEFGGFSRQGTDVEWLSQRPPTVADLSFRGVCLQAWKTFSKLLLQEDDDKNLGLYRFRQHICRPDDDLKHYIRPLTSPTVEFITQLTISGNCSFTTNELLHLTEIKNLGVLELIQPADELLATFPDVNDSLVRGWAEQPNAFPLLRILRIWGNQSVTQQSLHWVTKFQSLVMYDVMGSRDDWESAYHLAAEEGWQVSQPRSGLEDSLLQYLMLFSPQQELPLKRLKVLARNIDTDLVSLCSDPRCAIKFVPHGEAPPLMDYLTDPAKVSRASSCNPDTALREARACHGIAFEAWAFWLYSLVGQLTADQDLDSQDMKPELQTVVGPFVLPSKPMACLFLGHSGRGGISAKPSYVRGGLFSTKAYTFTRQEMIPEASPAATSTATDVPAPKEPRMGFKHNKRRRLDDILKSFS